jgi:hypothetical protein
MTTCTVECGPSPFASEARKGVDIFIDGVQLRASKEWRQPLIIEHAEHAEHRWTVSRQGLTGWHIANGAGDLVATKDSDGLRVENRLQTQEAALVIGIVHSGLADTVSRFCWFRGL